VKALPSLFAILLVCFPSLAFADEGEVVTSAAKVVTPVSGGEGAEGPDIHLSIVFPPPYEEGLEGEEGLEEAKQESAAQGEEQPE
jgi:hypothetical protein